MLNRLWLISDWQQRFPSAASTMLWLRRMPLLLATLSFGLTPLLLVLLLTSCQTQPVRPCEPQPAVTMPALTEPLPSVSYSISAGKNIKLWANELTGTPATYEP